MRSKNLEDLNRDGYTLERVTTETGTYRHYACGFASKWPNDDYYIVDGRRTDTVKSIPSFVEVYEYLPTPLRLLELAELQEQYDKRRNRPRNRNN